MLISERHAKLDLHKILQFAAFTRVLALLLQAVLNAAIPDHVADAFSPPRAEKPLLLDPHVEVLLGGLGHWDAEHFLFIAEHGYLYEHNHAFFPLFPLILRSVADTLLWPLSDFLTVHGRLLVALSIFNSALFLLSAVALYGLSCVVLQDRTLALITSLIYCLTPANVFMLAGYSECLFAALIFAGLFLLERGFTLRASVLLGLATATRANGLVNVGFLMYLSLQQSLAQVEVMSKGSQWHVRLNQYIMAALYFLTSSLLHVVVIVLPFCLFQYYGFHKFCMESVNQEVSPMFLLLAKEKGYRVPDAAAPRPSWCLAPIPVLYSYIQDVYWDVGFLRYFQFKQIPNFFLALPIVILTALAFYKYIQANPQYCLHLGLGRIGEKGKEGKPSTGFYSPKVFVYVVHCFVLLMFGAFCMHVQVLTRFLASSSPVVYWISSHILLTYEPILQEDNNALDQQNDAKNSLNYYFMSCPDNHVTQLLMNWRNCSVATRCILGYFILYWFLGLALHCNFLPWT